MTEQDQAPDGYLTSFIFPGLAVRGAIVQVAESWSKWSILRRYPGTVHDLLGQAMAAVPLMASTLKFEGVLSLQAQGDGALPFMVVQSSNDLEVRGTARWKGEIGGAASPALFGKGQLGIIIEPYGKGQRYEALVPLEGETIAECLAGYFNQSEQLDTRLLLCSGESGIAGMFLQRMPAEDSLDSDAWPRLTALLETLTNEELLGLSPQDIIRRLFHEETLQVFAARAVSLRCRCSHGKTSELLLSMGEAEVRDILAEQGQVEMECGFCGHKYIYDPAEIDALFAAEQAEPPTETRH